MKNYLEEAVTKSYKDDYAAKGLKLRARPFLDVDLPKNPNKLLVVGVALGGAEEIEALNKYFSEYDIYGIDVSQTAVKQKLNAKLVLSDISDLKFEDNYFSGIMCSAVMHEVYSYSKRGRDKVRQSISEISRVLTKGGICAIREFFVPENKLCKLICLTPEAKDFTKKFIDNFRKNFNIDIKSKFKMKDNEVYSTRRLLTELMLHFRVTQAHFNSVDDFLDSKEIEEEYLHMSVIDYSEFIWDSNMEIIGLKYIDFPKYYEIIDKHFKLGRLNNEPIKNKFGFIDLIFKKK